MDGCNVSGLCVRIRSQLFDAIPCVTAKLQRLEYDGHHAVILAKLIFAGDDGAGERSCVVRRVLHADSHSADDCAGVILGFACRNGLSGFRHSLDRCDSLITGGFDCRFRIRCIDGFLAGVPRSFQLGNASFIILALVAGIERGFNDGDGRLFELGDRIIVERFKHPLVIRLGNHLDRERNGAVIFGVLRNLVRNQIVAGPIDSVNACQRLRFRTQPCFTAVNRPDRPVQLVCCVQIIADKYIIASQGSFRQVARELPPVTRH